MMRHLTSCLRPAASALAGMLLLAACGEGAPRDENHPDMQSETMPDIVPAPEAIMLASIPTTDPVTLYEAEIAKVLPEGPRCAFSYTSGSRPILSGTAPADARDVATGVVKLHGRLVELETAEPVGFEALASGVTYVSDGLRMTVEPVPDKGVSEGEGWVQTIADLRFVLEQGLLVDYRGYYRCDA
ncbi:hypothetical protein [Parvularcula oceani]|uniref:hypothetical protein n=1 Tax=Parvularcula oceani TaxID=1247963 RepID=UPI0012DF9847|nr:hypothetical protein [Parvularcula oceani]